MMILHRKLSHGPNGLEHIMVFLHVTHTKKTGKKLETREILKSFKNRYCISLELTYGRAQITADGDCSHEIKRCLLLGRKVMTNLDSIFKSRDITLPTKVRLVETMVFPVVMYGCESWTVKKAEC